MKMKLNKNTQTYWIPLLEYSTKFKKIVWSGKALPLPINYNIKKESLKSGFSIQTSEGSSLSAKKGLFVKIDKKKYLLGHKNIFKSTGLKEIANDNVVRDFQGESQVQTLLKSVINQEFVNRKLKNKKTGLQLKISGRLGGANKKSRVVVKTGSFRPQSIDSKLDYSFNEIFTKWGVLGLKVYVS